MHSPLIRIAIHSWRSATVVLMLTVLALPLGAQEPATPGLVSTASLDAQRTCTRCHDEGESAPILSIMQSKHAVVADPRTPFADQACVTCHGASSEHMQAIAGEEKRAAPDRVFGNHESSSPSAVQNATCIGCHENGLRMHWRGSTHESQDVSCSSCHTAHTGHDPVLAKETQVDVCLGCHTEKRAELHRPYTHPLLDGQMACSDCHNPHGSNGPTLLVGTTVNETCYGCHAEKRGPFLWEHAPVREDCTNCHRPHGSVQKAMLSARTPWLCQQCHLAQFHPSTAYSGTGLPGSATPSGAQQVLGSNCLNCHSQVHGSNHPSGARITR